MPRHGWPFREFGRTSAIDQQPFVVMPVPVTGIHAFGTAWMAGTSPAMTGHEARGDQINTALPACRREPDSRHVASIATMIVARGESPS
jgi:hypothetical protein